MSESAVDRREFLTCSICLDIYKDPKLLPCGHTFCKVCLEGWVDVKGIEGSVKELTQLQDRVNQALASSKSAELLTVAREMTYGRGSVSTIKKLTSFNVGSFEHLHLLSTGSYGELQTHVASFIGVAKYLPDVETKEMFNCASGNNERRVLSLCHEDSFSPKVIVCFEHLGEGDEAQEVLFRESGIKIGSEKVKNTRSYKRWSKGRCMYAESDVDKVETHVKNMATKEHYKLCNNLRGEAYLCNVDMLSVDPFATSTGVYMDCAIMVGRHRAVDIDDKERALIIVEEAKMLFEKRKVLMYRRYGGEIPVATYTPPTPTFQPSDVCFYTMRGQQVLLVSDEANNAIHVVSVGEDSLTFVRFLTNNCPSLVCPTAMNIDVLGRLWVACRGGNILTMQPRQ